MLTAVLRSGEEPRLSRAQMQRVHRASIAHKAYVAAHPDSDDDEGPEDDDAWLYEDLILLSKLYARLRDREQLIALIFEVGRTPLAPLYAPTVTGAVIDCFRGDTGHHGGLTEGHHHDLLRSARAGVSRREHCRFAGRLAKLHE